MKRIENLLLKYGEVARGVLLSEQDKEVIYSAISEFQKKNPLFLQSKEEVRFIDERRLLYQESIKKGFISSKNKNKLMIIGIILAVFFGASTSFAAEGSVPGDLLYPIKIHVNENVRSAFAVSDFAEAHLQIELANERVREIEKLAEKDKLTVETRDIALKRFTLHVDEAKNRAAKLTLQTNARADISRADIIISGLETALSAHEKVLVTLKTDTPETQAHLEAVLNEVDRKLSEMRAVRIEIDMARAKGEPQDVRRVENDEEKNGDRDSKRTLVVPHILEKSGKIISGDGTVTVEGNSTTSLMSGGASGSEMEGQSSLEADVHQNEDRTNAKVEGEIKIGI